MSSPDSQDAERMERALEGRLSPAELEAFQVDVVRDPALRAAYTERVWMHSLLKAERERLPQLLAEDDAETAPPAPTHLWRWIGLGASAAACALAAWSWLHSRTHVAPTQSVPVAATLIQSANTKWGGSSLPTIENAKLGAGSLVLVEGIATLKFASGATVTIEAPTKLEVIDAMNCRLIEGSVTAEVPTPAHGFTIDTPDLKVRDLGTRFGVTAGSAGNSHVFVFEGEVALSDPAGKELRRLTAGKNYRIASGPVTANLEPRRFDPDAPIDGWLALTTAEGRGKDGYARRGAPGTSSGEPLIMVKHSDLERGERNERRGFLTFDIAELRGRPITEAQLVLDPEPSGLGFSSMVPDSRFSVYGVVDESFDTWDESTATWNTWSALFDAWPAEGRVRKLAEFSIPRGGSGNPLTVGGDAFADFLRSDTNGLATFIVVRETGESDPSGLVHAFASKEHPTARPPTLRVR